MHLSFEAQAKAHVDHLRSALPADWRDVPIESVAPAAPLGYRSRARLHVRCGPQGKVVVGMHEAKTHDPVEVDACVVLAPEIERARRLLAPLLSGSSGRGDVLLALGESRRPVLDIAWKGELASSAFGRLDRAVHQGDIAGARLTLEGANRPANIGDPTPWMLGADGGPLRLAPGGFAQASEQGNRTLVRVVASAVAALRVDHAVELYAGAGNLSILLAREVGDLVCVEADPHACLAARANFGVRAVKARVVQANAETYLFSPSTKLVVLDPPRAGARAVARRLVDSRITSVVYVACDTQTLGRDLAILQAVFEPVSLTAVELFPQTSHVEAVVTLRRRRP
jgi:23S rRNA (uracil1939-C5)-methyltransferase